MFFASPRGNLGHGSSLTSNGWCFACQGCTHVHLRVAMCNSLAFRSALTRTLCQTIRHNDHHMNNALHSGLLVSYRSPTVKQSIITNYQHLSHRRRKCIKNQKHTHNHIYIYYDWVCLKIEQHRTQWIIRMFGKSMHYCCVYGFMGLWAH